VYLPREAFGEPLGDDVLLGRPSALAAAPDLAGGARPSPVVMLAAAPAGTPAAPVRVRDLAHQLAEARGDPAGIAAAEAEISELLAEGATPRQVAACVAASVRRAEGGAGS
jgi:hypothetical protein